MWIGAISTPSRRATCIRPTSGLRKLRSMSAASALSGDTYKIRPRSSGGECVSESSAAKKAASVLPEPVGALRTASVPVARTGQASAWTAVGDPSASRIHVRAQGLSPDSDTRSPRTHRWPRCPPNRTRGG